MEYIYNTIRMFNWRIIRGIAELQILRKASYIVLLLVPILAGTWPAVRLYVNNHNDAVIQATKVLERQSIIFETSKNELINNIKNNSKYTNLSIIDINKTVENINKNSNSFSKDIAKFTNDFIPRTLNEPLLPWTWTAAFFASLFAVIAHLLYQLFAPEIVRKYTLDEFVKGKKEDYTNHPSEGSLKLAEDYLGTREGLSESKLDEERTYRLYKKLQAEVEEIYNSHIKTKISPADVVGKLSLSELSNLQSFIPKNMNLPNTNMMPELIQEAYTRNSEKTGVSDSEKQRLMTIIERGARAEYMFWAGKKLPMAIITTLIYTISIIVIFEIISIQSMKVMQASGWSSIFDLIKTSR